MNETPRSPNTNNQISPKKQQFLNELQELLTHYQYRLMPILQTSVSGITPAVAFPDVIPAPKPVQKLVNKPKKKRKKK